MNFLTEAVSRIRNMMQRTTHRPAVERDFITSKPTRAAGDVEPNESRVITWCRAFNRRSGRIVPAKSARSIFHKATRKTGRATR